MDPDSKRRRCAQPLPARERPALRRLHHGPPPHTTTRLQPHNPRHHSTAERGLTSDHLPSLHDGPRAGIRTLPGSAGRGRTDQEGLSPRRSVLSGRPVRCRPSPHRPWFRLSLRAARVRPGRRVRYKPAPCGPARPIPGSRPLCRHGGLHRAAGTEEVVRHRLLLLLSIGSGMGATGSRALTGSRQPGPGGVGLTSRVGSMRAWWCSSAERRDH